ncbi:MAG: preprotein translocase subunit SecE [Endomicrobia bacterium]|nr:preprotein translocase subunit SecE [Endomicrobiia bacterium]MCL2800037.1 preprotein translocase subunit SecE [Endomicrobiia bacterium]
MNGIKKSLQFFKDAYYELTKVTWLGRKEAVGTTVVVIIFIIIMSIYVSLVDMFLGGVLKHIL